MKLNKNPLCTKCVHCNKAAGDKNWKEWLCRIEGDLCLEKNNRGQCEDFSVLSKSIERRWKIQKGSQYA